MSQLQQLRSNAAWVAENFGKQSGIEPSHKVYKWIVNGREDHLGFYFAEFISRVLASESQA